jgi:hypothetical protein
MLAWIQMGIGVVVSVVLAYLGYRQSIGVKRERAHMAERELVRTVLKRMLLEDYDPTLDELAHVIDAIGRERDVPPAYLFTAEGCAAAVWAEALTNDLVGSKDRVRIGQALSDVLRSTEVAAVRPRPELAREYSRAWSGAIIAGAGASVLGAAVAAAAGTHHSVRDYLLFLAAAAIGAAASLLAAGARQGVAEAGQSFPSRLTKAKLDDQVERTLAHSGLKDLQSGDGLDYLVTVGERRIAIEAKAWGGAAAPPAFIASVERVYAAALAAEADELIIVTELRDPPTVEPRKIPIEVMSVATLRRHLVGLRPPGRQAERVIARLRPPRLTVTPRIAVLFAILGIAVIAAAAATLGHSMDHNGPREARASNGHRTTGGQRRSAANVSAQVSQMRVPWTSFSHIIDTRFVRSCGTPFRHTTVDYFTTSCTDHSGHTIEFYEYGRPQEVNYVDPLPGARRGCSQFPSAGDASANRPTPYGVLHVACSLNEGVNLEVPARYTSSIEFQWYYSDLPQIFAQLEVTNYSRSSHPPYPDWTTAYSIWSRDRAALEPPAKYLSGIPGP